MIPGDVIGPGDGRDLRPAGRKGKGRSEPHKTGPVDSCTTCGKAPKGRRAATARTTVCAMPDRAERTTDEGERPSHDPVVLRDDLRAEYALIAKAVADADGRFLTIKGWSVTLSLAGLGLGFQQGHYALFGLAALSGLGFWAIDALLKRDQLRYYSRMRDLEVASYRLNRVALDGLGEFSSPRVDEGWGYLGEPDDPRLEPPLRRAPAQIRTMLHRAWFMPRTLLPHAIAVVVGAVLFVLAATGARGLSALHL